MVVPEVLMGATMSRYASGVAAKRWKKTLRNRPDLLERQPLE